MNRQNKLSAIVFVLTVFTLLACSLGPVTISLGPTVTPSPTATPIPTETPIPSPTLRPTNTPRPSATARPSATPRSTATPSSNRTIAPLTPVGAGFGRISIASGVLDDTTPVSPRTTFPDGVTIVYAIFPFNGLRDGQLWRTEWLRDGQLQGNIGREKPWSGGAAGTWWVSIFNEDGISPGRWQLNTYLDNRLQQSAQFTIEANPQGKLDFGPIVFAPEVDANDQPVNPLPVDDPTFEKGATSIYAYFRAVNVPSGTEWTSQWFRNGQPDTQPKPHTWNFGPQEGTWLQLFQDGNAPLDPGVYELRVSVGGQVVTLGTCIVP
ncbi:MAG: hypothetical protein HY782_18875 [Chloroflexi bacterium]|nr:hypothetical protein [Chloroflexota bacterium]